MTKGEKVVVSFLCVVCGMLFFTILSFVVLGHSGQKGNILSIGLVFGGAGGIIIGLIVYLIGIIFEKAKKYNAAYFIQEKIAPIIGLIVFLTGFLFGFITVSGGFVNQAVVIDDGSGEIILNQSLLRLRNPYTTIISGQEVVGFTQRETVNITTTDGKVLTYLVSATFDLQKDKFVLSYDFWKSGGLEDLRQETRKRFTELIQGSIKNSLTNAIRYMNISSTNIEISQEMRDSFRDTGFDITGEVINVIRLVAD